MRRSSPTRCRSPHNHGASPPSPPSPPPLLPPVSLLDCCAFCVCLAPQLLMQAGVWATFVCILRALPFLVFQMPVDVARRQWTARALRRQQQQKEQQQSPSVFEDVVLCCVRWAFVHVPPHVGRVFFSRPVALPFFLFRQHHQQQQQQQQQHRSGYAGVWRTICAVADYVLSLMRSLPELFSASSALGSKDLNNNVRLHFLALLSVSSKLQSGAAIELTPRSSRSRGCGSHTMRHGRRTLSSSLFTVCSRHSVYTLQSFILYYSHAHTIRDY